MTEPARDTRRACPVVLLAIGQDLTPWLVASCALREVASSMRRAPRQTATRQYPCVRLGCREVDFSAPVSDEVEKRTYMSETDSRIRGLHRRRAFGWGQIWRFQSQIADIKPEKDKPYDRIRIENEFRISLAQSVGGAFVLLGFVVGYLNLRTLQNGQITDRFTKAVDQLGNEDFSIRLGGLYSLGRISQESQRDRLGVMEILCAYARAHSGKPDYREDIQALMRVIGGPQKGYSGALSLAGVDLGNLDLNRCNFDRVSFVGARFSGSDLSDSVFSNANLSERNFDNADFSRSVLDNAIMRNGSFLNTKLFDTRLRRVDLSGARLVGASFWKADLTDSNFSGATLVGSYLLQARLPRVNFRGANLTDVIVLPAQLALASRGFTGKPADSFQDGIRIKRTPSGKLAILHSNGVSIEESPILPGEFLQLYCDGLGDLQWPDPSDRLRHPRVTVHPRIVIDGRDISDSVTYAGVAPGSPASYQINVHVPLDLGSGPHSLDISVGKVTTGEIGIISAAPPVASDS